MSDTTDDVVTRLRRGGLRALVVGATLAALALEARSEGARIEVQDAWARSLPKVATSSEFYMVIRNRGARPDRLVALRCSACGMTELYQSYMSPQGAMGMRPVGHEGIEVPPGGHVELKPGGLHVMCTDRKGTFARGVQVPLTLRFERAGEIHMQVTIREP